MPLIRSLAVVPAALFACTLCAESHGALSFLSQARSVTAATSADANTQTQSAPDFAPFVTVLSLAAQFPTPGGGTGTNTAQAGIDCQIDPNGVQLTGRLTAAGGLNINGLVEVGETAAEVVVTFAVDAPTPIWLLAGPRGTVPGDRFKIKLHPLVGADLLFVDDSMPPQSVDFQTVLAVGTYTLEYEIELTAEGATASHDFNMSFAVPAPGALALLPLAVLSAARRRRR